MRIAVDLTALADNFSGIERYALNMTIELLKMDSGDIFELVFKKEVFPDFFVWKDAPNVHFHVLKPCKKLLFNQWRLPRYLNRLRAERYLFLAFPMPVLLRRKPVYGTIHDMGCIDCPETMKRQMAWYFRLSYLWMAKRAQRIITISEFSRGRIRELLKVPDEKIIVAYCGLSENFRTNAKAQASGSQTKEKSQAGSTQSNQSEGHEGRSAAGEPGKDEKIREKYHLPEQYYLCLSTLEPRKNMLFLLEVYLKLYQEGKIHTPLVLAGRKGWKIDELLERTEAIGEKRQAQDSDFGRAAKQQVQVTGFVDDADLPAIYRMAKCFVFPSIYEGFGIPPLEAMSQGVPVIASDASSMPEVLGGAAIYFRSNDADDLRRALLQMEQGNPDDLREHIAAGLIRSREFSYAREAKKVMTALIGCSE